MQSPSHVMVEVGLALAIVYILFFKKAYDPSKKCVAVSRLTQLAIHDDCAGRPCRKSMSASRHFTVLHGHVCRGYGARAVAGLSEKEKEELIAEWEPEPLGELAAVAAALTAAVQVAS